MALGEEFRAWTKEDLKESITALACEDEGEGGRKETDRI